MELMAPDIFPLERARSVDRIFYDPLPYHGMYPDNSNDIWLEEFEGDGTHAAVYSQSVLAAMARDSPALTSAPHPLTKKEILNAFANVLSLVQDASRGSPEIINRRILAHLRQAKANDEAAYAQSRGTDTSDFSPLACQRLFRSYAEASRYLRSYALGDVLFSFFDQNSRWIAGQHSSPTLQQWCEALRRAEMDNYDRMRCLDGVGQLRSNIAVRTDDPRGLEELNNVLEYIRAAIDAVQHSLMRGMPRSLRSRSAERFRGSNRARRVLDFSRPEYDTDVDQVLDNDERSRRGRRQGRARLRELPWNAGGRRRASFDWSPERELFRSAGQNLLPW